MREYIFRGKTEDGEWVYGYVDTTAYKDLVVIHTDATTYKVMPDTVGQYTGLDDANGDEIYEGDIVASTSGEFIYKVVYSKKFASFGLRRKQDMFMHYFGEAMESEDCEVIGNIYDNPELMEN